uniref:Uncharacterized protein n=1 Tax=Arion vulgaris TaxID=1028688 RepID=A0A0B7BNN4_9EUPU
MACNSNEDDVSDSDVSNFSECSKGSSASNASCHSNVEVGLSQLSECDEDGVLPI